MNIHYTEYYIFTLTTFNFMVFVNLYFDVSEVNFSFSECFHSWFQDKQRVVLFYLYEIYLAISFKAASFRNCFFLFDVLLSISIYIVMLVGLLNSDTNRTSSGWIHVWVRLSAFLVILFECYIECYIVKHSIWNGCQTLHINCDNNHINYD